MIKDLISCIIPVVRNDFYIEDCIKAIKESTYKNAEIIIVDEGLERSAQRNIGIKRATGEYLIWIDSDMRLHHKLLEDCILKIQGYTAVYIPERIVTEGWFGRLRDWERQFYNGTLVDVVRFIRTADCPLFDETLHGVEDSSWEREIIKQNPSAKFSTSKYPFHHHDKVGLIKYLKKKAYYARCLNQYRRKNPDDKLLTFKYRCFEVFVQHGKWKRLIRSPHLAFGVALLLLARGLIMKWQSWRYE
jgi:glycosyltransferase involved in cell wall biosynthesis